MSDSYIAIQARQASAPPDYPTYHAATSSTFSSTDSGSKKIGDTVPLRISDSVLSPVAQRIVYFFLLVLSLLALILLIFSTAFPSIFSEFYPSSVSLNADFSWTFGYWGYCLTVSNGGISNSDCVLYYDSLSVSDATDSMRAFQACAILSVVMAIATAAAIGLTPKANHRTAQLMWAVVGLAALCIVFTVIAVTLCVKKTSTYDDSKKKLDQGGIEAIVAIVMQVCIAVAAIILAVKKVNFNAGVWKCTCY